MQWNWEQIGAAALDFIIKYGGKLLLCLIIFIIGRIILKFLLKITNVAIKKTTVSEQAIKFVQAIIKVAFYIFIALAVLSIFGVPTTQFVDVYKRQIESRIQKSKKQWLPVQTTPSAAMGRMPSALHIR